MYKQPELEAGLHKLVDLGVVLMEDDWTVSRAVSDWYSMGGDDVSDKQTGVGFVPVQQWFDWLWDQEYITLLGAEDVQRAGSAMRSAAEDIQRAVANFDETVFRLTRALEEHANRVEAALKAREEGGADGCRP